MEILALLIALFVFNRIADAISEYLPERMRGGVHDLASPGGILILVAVMIFLYATGGGDYLEPVYRR